MIIDKIENAGLYPLGAAWKTAFDYLAMVDADTPADTHHRIQGDDIYAVVMDYDTRPLHEAKLETHRKYADIQVLLSGEEEALWLPNTDLKIQTPYDSERDAAFYELPTTPGAALRLKPGVFVMFFPDDAHMPMLRVGNAITHAVKKVVIKIRVDLLK
jgi:biofilm protein TabA